MVVVIIAIILMMTGMLMMTVSAVLPSPATGPRGQNHQSVGPQSRLVTCRAISFLIWKWLRSSFRQAWPTPEGLCISTGCPTCILGSAKLPPNPTPTCSSFPPPDTQGIIVDDYVCPQSL